MPDVIEQQPVVRPPTRVAPGSPSVEEAEPNVYQVLAAQARSHTAAQLWMTTITGVGDAAAILVTVPGLWWLAAGLVAVGAYGIWGLADRARPRPPADGARDGHGAPASALLEGFRLLVASGGTIAAVQAIAGFLRAISRGWIS